MNLRQRCSRYGDLVMFTAGVAGSLVVVAILVEGFNPGIEIWLSAALIVSIILHAKLGFALSRAQREVDMLRRLISRYEADIKAKQGKPTPVLRFSPMPDVAGDDAAMLERVRAAIEQDRIDLYLQPIVSLPQRKQRFFEAFSRLRDADGAVLKPTDYLEAAEGANRIGIIDNMILLRAVQAVRQFSAGDRQFAVFCNISPATLYDEEFFNLFADYLDANEDLASQLIFEFTYPAVEIMHPKVDKNLSAIAERGFAFSVDHVNALDHDWARLRTKNFRFAKATSGLLLNTTRGDAKSAARAQAFKQRLNDAGVDLIVEKVEYETDMPEILALGIDYGQGNLFGPPRPAAFYVAGAAPLAKAS